MFLEVNNFNRTIRGSYIKLDIVHAALELYAFVFSTILLHKVYK